MKKNLFLVLSLLVMVKVNAKTYYSDYSEFSDYSENLVEESDVVDVEMERRFIWKCEKAVGGYYKIGSSPILYYNINTNLYKEGNFNEWCKEIPTNTFITDIESRTVYDETAKKNYVEYRYRERLYYHYRIDYYNTDEYYSVLNNCEKIEDNYKDFYRYRTRDKIEISDRIVIIKDTEEVGDFIKSTSNYEIEGNINKNINDEYLLNIKTNYINVPIKIQVNIKDNFVKYYEPIIEKKEQLLIKIKNDLIIEKDKNTLLNDSLTLKDVTIFDLENKLNQNKETISSLERELGDTANQVHYCKEEKDKIIKKRDYYFEMYNNKLLDIKNLNDDKFRLEEELMACDLAVSKMESSIIEAQQEILELNNKITSNNLVIDKFNNDLLEADTKISHLNSLVSNNNIFEEKYVDVSKMLEICNINNKNLQEKLDLNNANNNKNIIIWIFVCCLFFMFLCLLKLLKKEFNK